MKSNKYFLYRLDMTVLYRSACCHPHTLFLYPKGLIMMDRVHFPLPSVPSSLSFFRATPPPPRRGSLSASLPACFERDPVQTEFDRIQFPSEILCVVLHILALFCGYLFCQTTLHICRGCMLACGLKRESEH